MKRCLLSIVGFLLTASHAPEAKGQATGTRVSGSVYDSVAKRPLAGAFIQMVVRDTPNVSRATATDSSGRFQLEDVPAGTWLLGFFHPALDLLGLDAPLLSVVIRDSTPVRAMLAIPSPRTIVRATCGSGSDSTGLWIGRTRSAETGNAVREATVVAQWSTLVATDNRVVRQTPSLSAETSEDGMFAICALPLEDMILARAWRQADSSGVVSLLMPAGGLLSRDMFMSTDSSARIAGDSAAGPDSLSASRRGPGLIRGIVRKTGGAPLGNVRLSSWETGVEVTTSATGHYQLDSLPLGTSTLEARAIGYLPRTQAVDIRAATPEVVDFVMESRQAYLDTVRVVGTRVYDSPQYREFLDRKKRGFGYFMDEDAIERRNPFYLTDLFRMIPGVRIQSGAFGGRVLMRGSGFQSWCNPSVFVDGMRMGNLDGFGFESFVSANDVRALEVYTRSAGMPAQFMTMDGCGAIVILTGGRRQKVPQ